MDALSHDLHVKHLQVAKRLKMIDSIYSIHSSSRFEGSKTNKLELLLQNEKVGGAGCTTSYLPINCT